MKKLAVILAFILAFESVALAADSAAVINNFAFNAAKLIAESSPEGNFFFSPYSIITAFGMVYAGAKGLTANEIERALNFSPEIHKNLGLLAKEINHEIFKSANRVWLQKGLTLNDDYKTLLADNYLSSAYELDFTNSLDSSRRFINNWVSRQTNGRIRDLLSTLTRGTLMILTNAVYFNAEWLDPFDNNLTSLKPFNYSGKKFINVPTMQKRENLQYGELDGMKFVRLPYKNCDMSMIVLLPEDGKTGLEGLNHLIFANIAKSMKDFRVDLWLPKFKTESKFNLNDLFMTLGVKTAFSDDADFSGITSDEGLKIDAIIHKTFIEVDEKKTEAAAATAITMVKVTSLQPLDVKEFHADRPFLYFVIDDKTGIILFVGRQTFK